MIINPSRWIPTRSAVALILPVLFAGCFFNLGEHRDFSSWYYGDPGMAGALGEEQCDRYADRIQGERHRYYLHFRTPEVLLQPQGGAHYPARLTAEGRQGGSDPDVQTCEAISKGWETYYFDTVDAGLVDTVIPYRKDTAVNERERGFGQASLAYAGGLAHNTGLTVVMKAPIYVVHDILKTLYIPVAGTYYLLKPDEPPMEPAEIIPVQDRPVSEEPSAVAAAPAEEPAVVGAEDAMDASTPSADMAESLAGEDMDGMATDSDGVPPPAGRDDDRAPLAQAEPQDAVVETPAIAGGGVPPSSGDGAVQMAADSPVTTATEPAAPPELDTGQPGPDGVPRIAESEPPAAEVAAASDQEEAVSTEPVREEEDMPAWPPSDEFLGIPIPPASGTPAGAMPKPTGATAPDDDVAEGAPAGETLQEAQDVPAAERETLADSPAGSSGEEPETAAAPAGDPVADPSQVAADTPRRPPDEPESPQADAGGYPDAATTEAQKVDAVPSDEAEAPAAVVDHTDEVAAAAAALAAVVRMGPGPEPAAIQTDPTDAPPTGTGPDDSVSPAPDEPSAMIAEEDLLAAEVTTDGRGEAEVSDTDREHPGQSDPSATEDASAPVASVTPAQQAVTSEAAPTPEPIEWVRIDKHKLHKKAAFIGFFSRSAGVDESTKAYLQDHLWPVFKERCDDDLTLLRRGDAGYPAALDSLVRDQFGRLNSFELTTVARFGGLNAIVAATIIDIRVASEISGILWYKSPEGQLRLTILMEVFDAETGTKLLDRTYIRKEEVEELEPGAGEALRPGDRPVLEAVLRSVAEDMGEHVCETLDDLPWRAYVSGINRERVTLSAGESAGLVAGNILKVYNSQIIDGLNNQQFFLTGEKVGRIQIIEVFPDRAEALLIEGQGLRDYSVAMP